MISGERDSDSGGYASPVEEEGSQVAEFFKDRCVFITGVSGFVGKVLLEKLLRSCERVRTVYVLMRHKDGQDPRQRLDELFTCQEVRKNFDDREVFLALAERVLSIKFMLVSLEICHKGKEMFSALFFLGKLGTGRSNGDVCFAFAIVNPTFVFLLLHRKRFLNPSRK
ncbi:fatty acyl-CoA reductase [Trichonephila inaurata madagascariensis]|uniref:Fatty acyl-CoA reductase n=1 Tax=Trichonephila inaurata madagascariensis TaxID=2747483 RepID=A0A8X7BYF0_9ARAC|nr:fatty acyl-CoA reductase [Trichonephila inaurata madagascariensis]